MKVLYLAFAFLILCTFSTGANTSKLGSYISGFLIGNETYKITTFNLSDGYYHIININNTPSLLLRTTLNGSIEIVANRDEIKNALVGYYASQGVSNDSKMNESDFEELLYLIDSYNKTRAKEFECKTYIGIDRFPCVDLDSCWRACTTPVCRGAKNFGGPDFIKLIWEFSNSSSHIDSNMSLLRGRIVSRQDLYASGKLEELIASVDNINNDSVSIEENDLFNSSILGFCDSFQYNLTYLTHARDILSKRYMVLQLHVADETSDEILNTTKQRISLRNPPTENKSNQSAVIKINLHPIIDELNKELGDSDNVLISLAGMLLVILAMVLVLMVDSIIRKNKKA